MSQLAGKAYEDSDYTIVIAVVHWFKCIIIVQKLTLVVEFWALFVFPLIAVARLPLWCHICSDARWQQQWCSQTL